MSIYTDTSQSRPPKETPDERRARKAAALAGQQAQLRREAQERREAKQRRDAVPKLV